MTLISNQPEAGMIPGIERPDKLLRDELTTKTYTGDIVPDEVLHSDGHTVWTPINNPYEADENPMRDLRTGKK